MKSAVHCSGRSWVPTSSTRMISLVRYNVILHVRRCEYSHAIPNESINLLISLDSNLVANLADNVLLKGRRLVQELACQFESLSHCLEIPCVAHKF
jgi:hypothetical protein